MGGGAQRPEGAAPARLHLSVRPPSPDVTEERGLEDSRQCRNAAGLSDGPGGERASLFSGGSQRRHLSVKVI